MADRARKYIEITADASKALRELRKLNETTAKTEKHVNSISTSFKQFATSLKFIGIAALTNQFTQITDAVISMDARLTSVTGSAEGAAVAFEDLLGVANRNASAIDTVSASYTKLSVALDGTGVSHSQLVDSLDLMTGVLAKTGATTQQTNAVLLQMSQALASGVLQGDEFRSVYENAPVILNAFRKAAGLTDTAMKELSATGQLTAQAFFENLEAIKQYADEMIALEGPPKTVAAGLTILRNELIALGFDMVQSTDQVEGVVDVVFSVADAVEMLETPIATTINVLGALLELLGTIGSVFGEFVSGLGQTAANIFDAITSPFTDGKPIIDDFADFFGYTFEVELPHTIKFVAVAIETAWKTIRNLSAALVEYLVTAWDKVKIAGQLAFATMSQAVQKTILSMVQWVLDKVQLMVNAFYNFRNAVVDAVNTITPGEGFKILDIPQLKVTTDSVQALGAVIGDLSSQYDEIESRQDKFHADLENEREILLELADAQLENYRRKLEDSRLNRQREKDLKKTRDALDDVTGGFDRLNNAAGGGSKALKEAAKQALAAEKALLKGEAAIKKYLEALEAEIELAKLSEEAKRAQAVASELNAKAADLENKAAVALADGNEKLADTYKQLEQQWRDAIPEAQRLTEELHDTEEAMADAENTAEELADAFADSIVGMFSDSTNAARDFIESLYNILIDGLKQIIATWAKNAILPTLTGKVDVDGSGKAADATGGTGISSFFGGTSLGKSIADLGTEIAKLGGIFEKFGNFLGGAAGTSNIAIGVGGIGGTLLGNALFGDTFAGQIGSALGAAIGTAIGAALGPVGAIVGGLLGGAGGGFIGSLFGGDEEKPLVGIGLAYGQFFVAQTQDLTEAQVTAIQDMVDRVNDELNTLAQLLGWEAQKALATISIDKAFQILDMETVADWLTHMATEAAQQLFDAVGGALGEVLQEGYELGGVEGVETMATILQTLMEAANAINPGSIESMEEAAQLLLDIGTKFELGSFGGIGELGKALDEAFEEGGIAKVQEIIVLLGAMGAAINLIRPDSIANLEEAAELLATLGEELATKFTVGLITISEILDGLKTDAERLQEATEEVERVFGELGIEVPKTVEEFKKFIDSLDLTTEEAARIIAALGEISPELKAYIDSLREQEDALEAAKFSLEDYVDALKAIDEELAGTRQSIEEHGLSDEELYNRRREEADRLAEQLAQATDPEEIARLTAEINDLMREGWGFLTDEQRDRLKQEFLDYLDSIAQLAKDRLGIGTGYEYDPDTGYATTPEGREFIDSLGMTTIAAQEFGETADVAADSMKIAGEDMRIAAEIFMTAAQAIPKSIRIDVTGGNGGGEVD